MTTYEFEVASKNEVIKFAEETLALHLCITDVDVVCMTHVLGYKKCLLMSHYTPYYYEVTYNRDKDEIYFDVYEKKLNKKVTDYRCEV